MGGCLLFVHSKQVILHRVRIDLGITAPKMWYHAAQKLQSSDQRPYCQMFIVIPKSGDNMLNIHNAKCPAENENRAKKYKILFLS